MQPFKPYSSFKTQKNIATVASSSFLPRAQAQCLAVGQRRNGGGSRRWGSAEAAGGDLGAWGRSPEAGRGGAGARRRKRAAAAAGMAGGAGNSGEAQNAARSTKKFAKIGEMTVFTQGTQWCRDLPVTLAGSCPRRRWVVAGRRRTVAALREAWELPRGTGVLHACWGSSRCAQKLVSLTGERIWIFGWILLWLRSLGLLAAFQAEVEVRTAR